MPARKNVRKKDANKKGAQRKGSIAFKARHFFLSPFYAIWWMTKRMPVWLKWPSRLGLSAGVIASSLAIFVSIIYYIIASTYDLDEVVTMPARTEILDRDGNILKNSKGQEVGYLHGKNRRIVSYDEVSPYFVDALIAREDARFREHGAVDLRAFGRVAFRFITRGKLEGGGTISMQLARNSYRLKIRGESFPRGVHRKILETFIAVRIESRFSKNEILEHYMNRIFWGGSIQGIEVASKTYFNKKAKDLTLSEAAVLAGIIRAPNAFSPLRFLDKAQVERDTVLDRMVHYGSIEKSVADEIRATKLSIPAAADRLTQGSYALDAIRRDLERILEEENIRDGGLIITTTLDPDLQELTEKTIEKRLRHVENYPGYRHQKRSAWSGQGDPQYLQGAVVVIENKTGAVLALVGGRNASESQYNRALQGGRPVGSIFKPFIYLAAFKNGLSPRASISDAQILPGEITGAPGNWSPKNSDEKYYRSVSVLRALTDSRNTSSIRVAEKAGLDDILEVARVSGFNVDKIDRVPSSYLGSWDAPVETVASAYSIFPNGGQRFRPYYIQSIKDRKGNILWENGPIPYRATEAGPAWDVSRILEQTNKIGSGRAIRSKYGFRKPSAGKTGTTNDYKDAWYAGYTSSLSCAVWVGLDTPAPILKGGYGSTLALPIWVDIMKSADPLGYKSDAISPATAELVTPDTPDQLPLNPNLRQDEIRDALPLDQ